MTSTQRRHWLVGSCIALVVIVIASVAYGLARDHGPDRSPGCFDVSLAGIMGGVEVNECGQAARTYCANPPQMSGANRDLVADACRKADINP